jgi:hypothetical protein
MLNFYVIATAPIEILVGAVLFEHHKGVRRLFLLQDLVLMSLKRKGMDGMYFAQYKRQ